MLHALTTLAAEAATSKTPFYIVGSLLAAWAVLLTGIGMTRPSFPGDGVASYGAIAITSALVLATAALAIVTA